MPVVMRVGTGGYALPASAAASSGGGGCGSGGGVAVAAVVAVLSVGVASVTRQRRSLAAHQRSDRVLSCVGRQW